MAPISANKLDTWRGSFILCTADVHVHLSWVARHCLSYDVPLHCWFLGHGKLTQCSGSEALILGNIHRLATSWICTLHSCSIQCVQIRHTATFIELYCYNLKNLCCELISHTWEHTHTHLEHRLYSLSKKIANNKFLTSASLKRGHQWDFTEKNAFATCPSKFLSSPSNHVHPKGRNWILKVPPLTKLRPEKLNWPVTILVTCLLKVIMNQETPDERDCGWTQIAC